MHPTQQDVKAAAGKKVPDTKGKGKQIAGGKSKVSPPPDDEENEENADDRPPADPVWVPANVAEPDRLVFLKRLSNLQAYTDFVAAIPDIVSASSASWLHKRIC